MKDVFDKDEKYFCPNCGAEMIVYFEKPALNLYCPKCGCRVATTKWEEIDLDETIYTVLIKQVSTPTIDLIREISHLTGLNFINSKAFLQKGGTFFEGRAVKTKEKANLLIEKKIGFEITPPFPYEL